MKYSIIIPAFKEETVIGESLESVAAYLKEQNQLDDTEVIVVAADAGDRTAEIAQEKATLFPHFHLIEPGAKVGKGRDVTLGMMASKGDYVLFTDADLATPVHHINDAWRSLETGLADVVIGQRNLVRIHKGYRIFLSLGANLLTRIALLPGIGDTQCGFKAFTRTAAQDIFSHVTIPGWGFDFEVLTVAREHGYRIQSTKIDDWHDPKIDSGLVGESGFSATKKTLKELSLVRSNRRKGLYAQKTQPKN
jgi:dolichyl-phosphate beta-glucosyltransferase